MNTGYEDMIQDWVRDINNDVIESSEGEINLEQEDMTTIEFLIRRFGPEIVFDSMGGIILKSAKYFINQLRKRCARKYSEDFEGGTNG